MHLRAIRKGSDSPSIDTLNANHHEEPEALPKATTDFRFLLILGRSSSTRPLDEVVAGFGRGGIPCIRPPAPAMSCPSRIRSARAIGRHLKAKAPTTAVNYESLFSIHTFAEKARART